LAQICKKTNKNGSRCKAFAQKDSAYCFTHDPTRSLARHRARQRGGHNRRQQLSTLNISDYNLRTTKGLLDLMDALMKETATLGHSVKRDQTLSHMARIQSRLVTQYKEELDKRKLDRAIAEIHAEHELRRVHDSVTQIEREIKEKFP